MPLEMNPEIRAQWCAALRSGEYPQTKGELRDDRGYCCLGVLTDLYVKAGNALEFTEEDGEFTVWSWDTILAPPVSDWAGLYSGNPHLTAGRAAAEVNDDGYTFAEIANLIDGGQPVTP